MRISILMSVYNTKPFLVEAVESVLNQTVKDFEFIIVDDGSTDGSLDILRCYAAQDSRIKLIEQANQGCSQAWNNGLKVAGADWIFRFDSDDVMYPNRLERQVAFIERNPEIKVASCKVDYIDEWGRKIMTSNPDLLTKANWDKYYRACRAVIIPHTGAAIHRQTLQDMGGYGPPTCCTDTILFSRMMEEGHLILVQPEILGVYRLHSSSIMSQSVFWGEVASEWIQDNWQRRRRGEKEIDWETYQDGWRGWRFFLHPNRVRKVRARIHAREITRLLRSSQKLRLGAHLLSLCLTAPDYVVSRLLSRFTSTA